MTTPPFLAVGRQGKTPGGCDWLRRRGTGSAGAVGTGGVCTAGTAGNCAAASPVIEVKSTPTSNHQRRCTIFASPFL